MANIGSQVQARIVKNPEEPQRVIIRVDGDLDECERALIQAGFEIGRRLRLIKGFAATARGKNIRQLADHKWVVSIEEDGTVNTLKGR